MATQMIRTYESDDGSVSLSSRNGIDWMNAPLPLRIHRCYVQTEGWTNYFTLVWRCACGAIAMPQGSGQTIWLDKNSRRKS